MWAGDEDRPRWSVSRGKTAGAKNHLVNDTFLLVSEDGSCSSSGSSTNKLKSSHANHERCNQLRPYVCQTVVHGGGTISNNIRIRNGRGGGEEEGGGTTHRCLSTVDAAKWNQCSRKSLLPGNWAANPIVPLGRWSESNRPNVQQQQQRRLGSSSRGKIETGYTLYQTLYTLLSIAYGIALPLTLFMLGSFLYIWPVFFCLFLFFLWCRFVWPLYRRVGKPINIWSHLLLIVTKKAKGICQQTVPVTWSSTAGATVHIRNIVTLATTTVLFKRFQALPLFDFVQ